MTQNISQGLLIFGLALVPLMLGIIFHEVAHGWVAYKLGDPTAKFLGRLTLNPIKHVDPMGLGMFAFTAFFTPFILGWAKPVPVQPRYFRKPREGMMLVSVAGPLTNFLLAFVCALVVKLTLNLAQSGIGTDSTVLLMINQSAQLGITINCTLALFNLLPIPPLDGSHILSGLLPGRLAQVYDSIGRYGMMIIILLLVTGFFGTIMVPLIRSSSRFIAMLSGL